MKATMVPDENHCDACDSPIDDHRCKGCEAGTSFRDDSSECTGYCDGCAQNRMLELEAMLERFVASRVSHWALEPLKIEARELLKEGGK